MKRRDFVKYSTLGAAVIGIPTFNVGNWELIDKIFKPSYTIKKLFLLPLTLSCFCCESIYAQSIDWGKLSNPIFSMEDWSVKDACMIYNEEDAHFYLFFSAFYF
ncbi:MAG: hypothetical protein AAF705_13115, partial [Bacteroidota bacterium]